MIFKDEPRSLTVTQLPPLNADLLEVNLVRVVAQRLVKKNWNEMKEQQCSQLTTKYVDMFSHFGTVYDSDRTRATQNALLYSIPHFHSITR